MRQEDLAGASGQTQVIVAGAPIAVNKNDNIAETLESILCGKGIDSFTIFVNGNEITNTASLPEKFDGNTVVVERFAKAGC